MDVVSEQVVATETETDKQTGCCHRDRHRHTDRHRQRQRHRHTDRHADADVA